MRRTTQIGRRKLPPRLSCPATRPRGEKKHSCGGVKIANTAAVVTPAGAAGAPASSTASSLASLQHLGHCHGDKQPDSVSRDSVSSVSVSSVSVSSDSVSSVSVSSDSVSSDSVSDATGAVTANSLQSDPGYCRGTCELYLLPAVDETVQHGDTREHSLPFADRQRSGWKTFQNTCQLSRRNLKFSTTDTAAPLANRTAVVTSAGTAGATGAVASESQYDPGHSHGDKLFESAASIANTAAAVMLPAEMAGAPASSASSLAPLQHLGHHCTGHHCSPEHSKPKLPHDSTNMVAALAARQRPKPILSHDSAGTAAALTAQQSKTEMMAGELASPMALASLQYLALHSGHSTVCLDRENPVNEPAMLVADTNTVVTQLAATAGVSVSSLAPASLPHMKCRHHGCDYFYCVFHANIDSAVIATAHSFGVADVDSCCPHTQQSTDQPIQHGDTRKSTSKLATVTTCTARTAAIAMGPSEQSESAVSGADIAATVAQPATTASKLASAAASTPTQHLAHHSNLNLTHFMNATAVLFAHTADVPVQPAPLLAASFANMTTIVTQSAAQAGASASPMTLALLQYLEHRCCCCL
jgi:hypothetical protein